MRDVNKIHIDDLPEVYRSIAEICGTDAAIEIARTFSGEEVYFPKFEAVERPLRNRKIREEFNGYNFKSLAKKYGLTEQAIRVICSDRIKAERGKPLDGQMSFFDL